MSKHRNKTISEGFSPKWFWAPAFAGAPSRSDGGFMSLRRSAQQGFTLLEMLVALAVFSLAALALIRLQAVTVRTTADLDERQMARIVAHNMMVDIQTSLDPVATGEAEGTIENGGRSWHWDRKISRTDEEDVVRIDIRVERAVAGSSPAVLSFLKAQS